MLSPLNFNYLTGVFFMGKILADLKLTVITGLVLTAVIYYISPIIAG